MPGTSGIGLSMSFAPWQRTQWAIKIGRTSFVYVGIAGTSGLQPRFDAASAIASGNASTMTNFLRVHVTAHGTGFSSQRRITSLSRAAHRGLGQAAASRPPPAKGVTTIHLDEALGGSPVGVAQ